MTTPRWLSQRWNRAVVGAALAALFVGGCSADAGVEDSATGTRSTSESTSPVPSSTIPPEADAAVKAYEAFWRAANNAKRQPVRIDEPLPRGADFTRHSFDPARTTYLGYIAGLKAQGVQFRGAPPQPRIRVAKVETSAKPYPTVTLTDCQSPAPTWNEYVVESGKRVPAVTASVLPPYEITARMIFYRQHWGLQSVTTDTSRTCTR